MAIPDRLTAPAFTAQTVTTTVVSTDVLQWPNDAERNAFFHSDKTLRIRVTVAFAGMASGGRFEYRADTAASLAAAPIVMAVTRILTAAMLAANSVHFLDISAMRLPSGYDFTGLFWVPVSEAASGGASYIASLVEGPEDIDAVE